MQLRYEILDDEPLDHESAMAQVTALIEHVEGLVGPAPDSDAQAEESE